MGNIYVQLVECKITDWSTIINSNFMFAYLYKIPNGLHNWTPMTLLSLSIWRMKWSNGKIRLCSGDRISNLWGYFKKKNLHTIHLNQLFDKKICFGIYIGFALLLHFKVLSSILNNSSNIIQWFWHVYISWGSRIACSLLSNTN